MNVESYTEFLSIRPLNSETCGWCGEECEGRFCSFSCMRKTYNDNYLRAFLKVLNELEFSLKK